MSSRPYRRTAALTATALLTAGLAAVAVGGSPAAVAADPVTVTEEFEGTSLDPRWSVLGSDPTALSVSNGSLRITGQAGDTFQDTNTAKNIVMLDVPAGDFTATAEVAAPVAQQFQGAGLIAWKDIDNYVRSGLTFVGDLPAANAPSGIAVENDIETAARFSASSFSPQPAGTSATTLRMQRVGNTITTSYLAADGTTFVPAGSVQASFETTQVGLYALGALDGATLAAAFESITVQYSGTPAAPASATLSIDGDGKGVDINDDMFGVFYEDINYAADGGLYAELVRNRSFEFNTADNAQFTGLTAWQAVGGATLSTPADAERLNDMNRTYLNLAGPAGSGVRNLSYNNGFAIQQDATYEGYLWARSATEQELSVGVQTATGAPVSSTSTVAVAADEWTQLPYTLTGTVTTDAGRLVVTKDGADPVLLDMVSLMPADRWVGASGETSVLRKDLAEKIADLDPGFLRFPGGCVTNFGDSFSTYAESQSRRRTYQWKETIGPVEERPTNFNFWGYNQSYGIGYLEYFQFAEDLGAEALPVVSVGANGCSAVNPSREMQVGDANFDRWVQDTVDLVEFANGDVTTEWGGVRAELGHPEPFGLEYLGLGNEENSPTFEANFPAFRDAVQAEFPDIKIISNSGPDSSGQRFDTLWRFNRAQGVDLVDEHYYRSPSWFKANNRRYDGYSRAADEPKVFLGEYASRFNGNNNDASNLNFANGLSEAAYMTSLQRNADVVQLAAYAPLLANESALQWSPDAIFFDNDESWARPSWHVQTMFGQEPGTQTVPSTLDASANAAPDVAGGVFLSTWNTAATYDNVRVTDNETGAPLFSDDFAAGAGQWTPQAGTWAGTGGTYRQSSTTQTDARSIVTGAYEQDWDNYTLELDATKTAGAEGFLVGFGAQAADDYYWYNLGGFNNTRALLQKASGGAAEEIATPPAGSGTQSVVNGQTYRLKIVVEGSLIQIYVDGQLQISYDTEVLSQSVYQVVTRDEDAGTITAKVVNTSATPVSTRILTSDVALAPTAQVTTLTGDPGATNTKTDPDRIAPRTSTLDGISNDFTHTFPKHSVSFVTMTVTGNLPAVPPTNPPSTGGPGASPVASTVGVKVRGTVTTRNRAKARVSVRAALPATGQVTVQVRRKGRVVATRTATLTGGRATVRLPRLRPGKQAVIATYAGSPAVAPAADLTRITVRKPAARNPQGARR